MISYRDETGKPFSQTYLKTVNNQLSALMNYAVAHYRLPSNPCKAAGSMGKSNADEMNIWTQAQYEQFSSVIQKSSVKLAFLEPKTPKAKRCISIPDFLYEDIHKYVSKLYGIENGDQIFYFTKSALEKEIKSSAKKAGPPPIRVHNLWHSHASMLIEFGFTHWK